jgi:uncharacterized delta-60 repeat protein
MSAQDGSLDSSFGDNGIQLQEFDCNHMYLNSVLELENGSVFISGLWYYDDYTTFLMQINADGAPVSTYGNNGFIGLPDTFNILQIEKQLPNNQFLVFGENTTINDNVNALYRMDQFGSVDLTYGTNGALIPALIESQKTKYLILDDASVLIATHVDDSIIIKKYTANGTLDEAFDEIEISLTNQQNVDSLFDFKTSTTGKYYIGLREYDDQEVAHLIYRINQDGFLDESFGDEGVRLLPEPEFSETPYVSYLTVLQNNQVVVSRSQSQWWGDVGSQTETKLYKVNSNGSMSNNFGDAGLLTISNYRGSVVEQPNGRLLYFGIVSDFEGGLTVLMNRYDQQGNLDASFNLPSTPSGFGSVSMLNHSNEKIYLIGTSVWYSPPTNFTALRYNNSPLGIEEENTGNFSVLPNPSKDIFTISHSSLRSSPKPYAVFDLKGTLLIQGEFQKQHTEVDLSPFESGIYLLKVENSTFKLVKN